MQDNVLHVTTYPPTCAGRWSRGHDSQLVQSRFGFALDNPSRLVASAVNIHKTVADAFCTSEGPLAFLNLMRSPISLGLLEE